MKKQKLEQIFRYGDKLEKISNRLCNNMRITNPTAKQIKQQKKDLYTIAHHFEKFTEAASHFEKLSKNEDARRLLALFFKKIKSDIAVDMELCRINRPNMPEFEEFAKLVKNTTFTTIINPDLGEIDDRFNMATIHRIMLKNEMSSEDLV